MPKYVTSALVSLLLLLCAQAKAQPVYETFTAPSVTLPALPLTEPQQPLQGSGNAGQDALPCAAAGEQQAHDLHIPEYHPMSILDCI